MIAVAPENDLEALRSPAAMLKQAIEQPSAEAWPAGRFRRALALVHSNAVPQSYWRLM
jgi:hypothetical protein